MRRARGLGLTGAALVAVLLAAGCGIFGGGEKETAPTGTGSVEGRVVLPGRQGGFENLSVTVQGTNLKAPVRPDGTFKLDGVPAGEQTVSVISEEGNLGAHVLAMVEPGKVTSVGEVKPIATGMIAGIVTGKTSGGEPKPVAGARVVARPILSSGERLSDLANGRPFLVAGTNSRGEYVIRAVPPGDYLLEARHPKYAPATKEVSVEAHSTANGDLVMEPKPEGGAVYGKVVAEVEGQPEPVPVPGAVVALVPKVPEGVEPPPKPISEPLEATVGEVVSALSQRSHGPWSHPLFAFTGADGTYRIDGVPAGEYVAVAAKAGYGMAREEVEVSAGKAVEVNFVLRIELGEIAGTVKRADNGEPIEGARVWAISTYDPFVLWKEKEEFEEEAERRPVEKAFRLPPMRASAVTDEEGQFAFKVRPGSYIVVAWARGFKKAHKKVEVAADQTAKVEFALEPLQVPPPPPSPQGLRLILRLDGQSFRPGEKVEAELKLINASDKPVTLTFPTSQRFDLVVRNKVTGEEVWRWSHGKVFLQVVVEVTLEPGEEMEFEATWDQRDNKGRQVPSGDYIMVGELAGEPKVVSQPVEFKILPRL